MNRKTILLSRTGISFSSSYKVLVLRDIVVAFVQVEQGKKKNWPKRISYAKETPPQTAVLRNVKPLEQFFFHFYYFP